MRTREMLSDRAAQPVIRARALQNLSTAYLFTSRYDEGVQTGRLAVELTPDSLEAKGALLLALHEARQDRERDSLLATFSKSERESPVCVNLIEYINSGRRHSGE